MNTNPQIFTMSNYYVSQNSIAKYLIFYPNTKFSYLLLLIALKLLHLIFGDVSPSSAAPPHPSSSGSFNGAYKKMKRHNLQGPGVTELG